MSLTACRMTRKEAAGELELRKRLWLMIAKHTVETVGNEQPRLAMKILDECPRVMDSVARALATPAKATWTTTTTKRGTNTNPKDRRHTSVL